MGISSSPSKKLSRSLGKRKKAGEALQESEERFRMTLEKIEDGYYEIDLAGNFTFL